MQQPYACPQIADRAATADLSPAAIVPLLVAVALTASIPVLTHPLPPLADYLNHLAGAHVIGVIDKDPDLARFYSVDWELIPNLMFDLVVPALSRVMGIYAAGQAFTVLAFVLILSGTLALNRALIGRWSALPLIAVPFLYNGVLLVGVMNYVFGIGLALWATATWVALRERAWPWRLATSSLLVLLLYVCHLFVAGLYGLALLAFELARLWSRRTEPLAPRLVDFVATGLPFLPIVLLLAGGSTWSTPGSPTFWELWGKADGITAAINVYDPRVAFALVTLIAVAAVAAWRSGTLHVHPVGWALLGIGTTAYLAMPRALFAAHLADQRLPIALLFMLTACVTVDLRTRRARGALVLLIGALLVLRLAEVQPVWDRLGGTSQDFLRSTLAIERGARVLVVHGDRATGREISDFELVHAASLATIERSAMVTTAFTVRGKHVLHPRTLYEHLVETEDRWPPYVDYFVRATERQGSPASAHFWDRWPRHYDYVYLLFTTPDMPNPSVKHLQLIHRSATFQLYRVQ